jgi:hypothetical protein
MPVPLMLPVVDPEILTKVNYCPPAIATQAVIQMSVNPDGGLSKKTNNFASPEGNSKISGNDSILSPKINTRFSRTA